MMCGPNPSIRHALELETVIWLSSTRPDGRPHLVPPHAQKVRNLRSDPRVMVAVGEPGLDFEVDLIEAVAEVLPAPTRWPLPDSFARKYGSAVARGGITSDRYAAVYSQPIRIHPIRWLDWGGRGWEDPSDHPTQHRQ
jgi:hypothetical protein